MLAGCSLTDFMSTELENEFSAWISPKNFREGNP
jgi:hypothetical protein